MLLRWFLGMTPDDRRFDHSTFTANEEHLGRLDVTRKFSDRIVRIAAGHGLLSESHFSLDGSLLQSHASLKSLKRIERGAAAKESSDDSRSGSDDRGPTPRSSGDSGPVLTDSNRWVDFRGENRSSKTHRGTTDPQSRLHTKTAGVACKSASPIAVPPADRDGVRARWHNQRRQGEQGYKPRQRRRRPVEEIFGWFETCGGLRRAMVVGRRKIQRRAEIGLGSLNLLRISRLVAM